MEKPPAFLLVYIFIFFQSITFTFSILNPLDFLALQSIHKSLSDLPGSNFFSSWDFTSDPCTFSGVYCDSDKVTALNLGDPRAGSPGLTGRLDPSLADLDSLSELTIVPGRIFGSLPKLPRSLRFVAISKNFLSGPIPHSFSSLNSLQTLDLSYNQLTGSIHSLGSLKSVSNLILCHNRLTGLVPSFESKTLTRLELKHNSFSGSLSSLPTSLHYLSLSSNQLTGQVDRLLTRLNRLNYLDLSMNRFTGPVPPAIFSYPITKLQLQRNEFTGPVRPGTRVSISTVDLSYNRLTGPVSPNFASVQNLYLNNNKFTGEVPGSFVERLLGADGMEVLYLQHNYLTGIELDPTVEIPSSTSLCLQYNCMVPPVQTPCPIKAGKQKSRPTDECAKWKKG